MNEQKKITMVQNLEGNMNFMIRAHKEGRLDSEHFYDMLKHWGLLYKKAIVATYIDQKTKSGEALQKPETFKQILAGMSVDCIKLCLLMDQEGDRFNNMLEHLIRKETNDKSSGIQNQG